MSSTTYCVDGVYGNDNGLGRYFPGNRTSCWRSSVGAQNAINSGETLPGDVIQYCRGTREFSGGLMIGGSTFSVGNSSDPIKFTSYDCRSTNNGTIVYPLPLISRSNLLPQSSAGSAPVGWQNVSWPFPNGTIGWMLMYNLTTLNTVTGNQFIDTFANRAQNGVLQAFGVWVNGVRYHLARYPNRVNMNTTHGNDTHEFMYLDPSRVNTNTTGWNYYVRSNSTDLFISAGSWCQMKRYLYGTNDAAWLSKGGSDNYYQNAQIVYRAEDYIIQATAIGQYTASTIDCSDDGAFVKHLVNTSTNPLGYGWDILS